MSQSDELTARVLDHSAADAAYRQWLVSEPGIGLTDSQRHLLQQMLERAAEDAAFRQQLVDDPQGAMESIGFGAEYEQAKAPRGRTDAVYWCLTSFLWAGNPDWGPPDDEERRSAEGVEAERQVLNRAVADSAFRRELLDDPMKAVAQATGKKPRRVFIESRDVLDELLDKARASSELREQLIDDPQAAMRAAGFERFYQEVQEAIHREKLSRISDLPCIVWSACMCWWGSCVGTEF
jgi:hypothetical protein